MWSSLKTGLGVLTVLLGGVGLALPAHADDLLTAPKLLAQDLGIDEVRLGAGLSNLELAGFVVADPMSVSKGRFDVLQLDVLFSPLGLPSNYAALGRFRPELGAVANLSGHESFVDAGLNWKLQLGPTPFYLETSLGLGAHNGYLNNAPEGYHNLGCPVLVHYSYGLGADINDHVTITGRWEHLSGLLFGCEPNQGLNDAVVQIGWKF